MIFGYRGGIRPVRRKDRTRRKSLCDLDVMPQELVIFLKQSTGAPAQPIVQVGQVVLEGEVIAQAAADGVAVHASLGGTIAAIEGRADGVGRMQEAIVIAVDAQSEVTPPVAVDWQTVPPDEMISLCRQLGLIEMVGAPQPMADKILDGRGKVDTLIINGTETEPYLTATHRLGLERGRELIAGSRLLTRVLGVQTTIFASTGDQIIAVERLERDLRRGAKETAVGRAMNVKAIPSRYPLYHDKLIILAATGREVPPEQPTIQSGCQVFSMAAVCALGRAFIKGTPNTRVPVTVSGLAVVRPRNLWAPVGTSFHTLLENCNGVAEEPAITLVGGLIRGEKVNTLQAPVEKTTTGLLCLVAAELPRLHKQETCIQCGSCISVCPMGLCPIFILRGVVGGQREKLKALHPQDCISCGACASVCPSHIPLERMMRQAAELVARHGEGETHEKL